jgi:hypothetical protein
MAHSARMLCTARHHTHAYACVPVDTFAPCLRACATAQPLPRRPAHQRSSTRACATAHALGASVASASLAIHSVPGEPAVCRSHSPIAQHALDDYLGGVSENEERDAQDMCAAAPTDVGACRVRARRMRRRRSARRRVMIAASLDIFGLSIGGGSSTGDTSEAKARIGPTQADLTYAGCPIANASDNMQHRP